MKRINKIFIYSVLVLLLVSLTACGSSNEVVKVDSCDFRYDENTNNYILNFGLYDKNDNIVVADAETEIWIENTEDKIVYSGKKNVTKSDYKAYETRRGSKMLAEVIITSEEMENGDVADGTINFYVNGDGFDFYDCKCKINGELPLID